MSKPIELLAVAVASLGIGALIGAQLFGEIPQAMAGPAANLPDRETSVQLQVSEERAPARSMEPTAQVEAAPGMSRTSAAAGTTERPMPPAAKLGDDVGASFIEGSIFTLDGDPLADVELELEPPSDAPKYRVRHATSGTDGRFEFTGLPQGAWKLTGRHPEYVLQRRTSYPTLVPTGARVELLACPGISVEVRVVGAEAERARVAYRRENRGDPEWSSWSPENPRIALLPGAWKVCAFVDPLEDWPSDRGWKLAPLASAERTVQVGTGEVSTVTLELEPVSCLYGTVSLPEGHQGNGSRPQLRLIEPKDGTRADFESEGDRVVRRVAADEQGRYGLFRLPYERWTAGVSLTWGTPSTAEVVEVHGLTRLDFDRFDLDGEGSVVVDAFSPAGQRITEGIRLSLLHRDPGDEQDDYLWQQTRTVLEEGGSLRVFALPMEPEAAEKTKRKKELVLRAWMAGFAVIDQPISALNGERFRLSFAASAELAVVLVGEGGLRAMRKAYGRLEGDQHDAGAGFDEAEGTLQFTGLHPGSYTLTVSSWIYSGDDWRQERLHHGQVDVRAGPQRLEIPMPTRADLVVRCPGVKKDVEAFIRSISEDRTEDEDDDWGGTYAQAKVDEFGQLRFENMLAGNYRLTIGSRVQLVRVPSSTIEFEGLLPARFMFRLEKGDSPLRRAGVRSGDLFVAIDGEELGKDAAQERLEELSTKSDGSLELTVERAGRRLDFTLEATDLGEDESFSVELEPDLDGAAR